MEQQTYRISWIDMAKGYGIIMVMAGHHHIPIAIANYIYAFHIPLFFFLSGYLFNTKKNFKAFAAAKIKRLIIPYFCLCIPMVFANLLFPDRNSLNIVNFTNEFVYFILQERHTTLWYLSSLLILNFIMYPMVKYSASKWISDIYCLLICLFGLMLWHFGIKNLFWNSDIALVVLPFFYTGYRFHNIMSNHSIQKIAFKKIITIVFLLGYIIYFLNSWNIRVAGDKVDLFYSNIDVIGITYLVAYTGITMMILVSMGYENNLIKYIGENSLLYFAWHQTIIFPFLSRLCWKIGVIQYDMYHSTYLFPCLSILLTIIIITILNEIIIRSNFKFILGK